MDVSGWLLHWIEGYLSTESLLCHFMGAEVQLVFDLGNPQGGVPCPTLFNILINVLLKVMPRQSNQYMSSTKNIPNHVLYLHQD